MEYDMALLSEVKLCSQILSKFGLRLLCCPELKLCTQILSKFGLCLLCRPELKLCSQILCSRLVSKLTACWF